MALYRTKNKTPGYNYKLGVAPGLENSWVNASVTNALSAISQDLPPVAEGTELTMDDISIPSPWAKFVSFESVLFGGREEYGALYDKSLNEWRGLLTLIALSELIGINVVYDTSIDLNAPSNASEEKFFKNLRLLTPGNFIFKNKECWNKITPVNINMNLMSFNIGMLSNSTIVCPPYHFSSEVQTILGAKPFFSNGCFIDPVPFIVSDSKRHFAMFTWLANLENYLVNNLPNTTVLGNLVSLISTFKADIGQPMVQHDNITINVPAFEMPDISQLMAGMNISVAVEDTVCKLQLNVNSKNKLILIDDVIMGVAANSDTADGITIVGSRSLGQKGAFKSGDRFYAGQAVPDDTEIYIASDLLLDKLTLISSDSTITNENADSGYFQMIGKDIIWPVNKILFNYMSAEEIRGRIRLEKASPTEYVVKLKVPLIAGEYEISKRYTQDDLNVIAETMMPYVSIWPYVKVFKEGGNSNLWTKYYTYCAHTKDSVPFEIHADIETPSNPYSMNCISDEYFTRNTYIYPDLPTHIDIMDKTNPTQYMGSILLAPSKKCDIQSHTKWTVGFDFGTTSTTAFYTEPHGKTSFIRFGTEYKFVRNTATQRDEQQICDEVDEGLYVALEPVIFKDDKSKFVPDMYLQRNAYPTIYEQQCSNLATEPEAFVKGHSMYSYRASGNELTKIYTDLKWNSDPDVRAAARNYIYQVLSQVVYAAAVKNVGEITWKLSYPTALSRALLEGYKNMTKEIIKKLEQDSGIVCKIEEGQTYYTESIAAAEYFGSQSDTGLFACVDIGGGSTDISIWKRGIETKNLLQTSINLASRAIFLPSITNLISRDSNIRNGVVALKGNIAKELEENQGEMTDNLRMAVEGILFEFEDRVQGIVENFESTHKNTFEKCISVGFISLLYYAMNAIAYVKDDIQDSHSITICLGGNGSKLYNWFPDYYKQDLKDCLRNYLAELIGKNLVIDIQYSSSNLKTEAARGLLNISGTESAYSRNTVTLMGERAVVTYKNGTTKELVSSDNIFDDNSLKKYYEVKGNATALNNDDDIKEIKIDSELKNIRKFIELCNKVHGVYDDTTMLFDYNDDDWIKIYEKIKYDLADEIRKGIMSPAFAIGVKAILSKETGRN